MSAKSGQSSALEAALALRDGGGDPAEAVAALEAVAAASSSGEEAGGEWAAAAYELALLLHGLGRHKEGDAWLRKLGFRHRLSSGAFCPRWRSTKHDSSDGKNQKKSGKRKKAEGAGDAEDIHQAVEASGPLPLRVVDGLLPEPLLVQLQTALGPRSPFWAEHTYPTSSFFSYNMPLLPGETYAIQGGAGNAGNSSKKEKKMKKKKGRSGAAPAAPPGGELMAAAAAALLPYVKELLAATAEAERGGAGEKEAVRKEGQRRKKAVAVPGCSSQASAELLGSVEWWAHSRRGAGAGHQLHFDLDEAALPAWREAEASAGQGRSCPVPHPEVSCVVYLDAPGAGAGSCSQRGAPTLVLDSDVDAGQEGKAADRGWLCFPRTNRALLFRGGLLHGVVPASSSAAGDEEGDKQEQKRLEEAAEDKGSVRTTLMLGFWRKSSWPAAGEPEGPAPTPNMREPFCHSGSDASAAAAPLWPSLFSLVPQDDEAPCGDEASAAETSSPKAAEVLELRPAWVEVGAPAEGEEEEEEEMEHGMEFVGSYFLEDNPGVLRNRLLYPSCSSSGVTEEAGMEDGGGGQGQGGGQAGGGGTQQVEMISLEELARLRGE